jgi:hypothetical protein
MIQIEPRKVPKGGMLKIEDEEGEDKIYPGN